MIFVLPHTEPQTQPRVLRFASSDVRLTAGAAMPATGGIRSSTKSFSAPALDGQHGGTKLDTWTARNLSARSRVVSRFCLSTYFSLAGICSFSYLEGRNQLRADRNIKSCHSSRLQYTSSCRQAPCITMASSASALFGFQLFASYKRYRLQQENAYKSKQKAIAS